MPIVVPPFVQYQEPLFPLRGLWNHAPAEGDRFASAEIDWGLTTQGLGGVAAQAVQFNLGGNSPVALSQICALVVDNNRCAADVTFLFPDSAFQLAVPGYAGGVFPVFTNALTFYAIAPQAGVGDVTILQVMNSVPPPVALLESQTQAAAAVSNTLIGTTKVQVVPSNVSGTLEALQIDLSVGNATAGAVTPIYVLEDGTNKGIWTGAISVGANSVATQGFSLAPIKVRFFNGLTMRSDANLPGSFASMNLYYGVP